MPNSAPLKGRIHSVETCGTVDGPGIRFIVFMQGCLMRCLYCHNRDTWDTTEGREVTVDELMKDLLTYRHFINASGGGITASGGEATLQKESLPNYLPPARRKAFTPAWIPMVLSVITMRHWMPCWMSRIW